MRARRSRDLVALLAVGVVLSAAPTLGPDARPDVPSGAPSPAAEVGVAGEAQRATGEPPAARARPVFEADRPGDRGTVAPDRAPSSPARTGEILPRELTGAQLLRRDDRFAEVARRNRIDVPRLRALLADDETVFVNTRGRVYFVDPRGEEDQAPTDLDDSTDDAPPSTAEAAAAALGTGPAVSRRYPTSETFRLNSKPGATRTIFIDADGATVTGTAWNDSSNRNPIPNGTWQGYDRDGGAGTFSDAEHAWVQEVWRQVSEAYAAFDVNVTTQDRGSAAYIRSGPTDLAHGSHVVITTSPQPAQAVCESRCLGVAYIGTFGDVDAGRHQPAWVFVNGADSATIAAQAVSHEVGHHLNLGHDAKPGTSYYAGTASWGPIMGAAMSRAVSHWSKGEYASPSNTQDDLAAMQQQGLPLRADDHGNDSRTARSLGAAPAYDVEGVISSRTDRDVVRLELSCATTLQAAARGVGAQTTLDLELDLLDAGGNRLQISSPVSGETTRVSTGMDASLSLAVAAGTYYLRVDGVGSGSGSVSLGTGWSDYASLGQYRLTATGCATAAGAAAPTPAATPTPGEPPDPSAVSSTSPTATSTPVPGTAPSAPRGAVAAPGRRGGPTTASLRWSPPAQTGGTTVTGYRAIAYQLAADNRVRRTFRTGTVDDRVRTLQIRLPRGRYTFAVAALNSLGSSPWSARSRAAIAR